LVLGLLGTSLKAGERSDIIYKEKDSNASSYGTVWWIESRVPLTIESRTAARRGTESNPI
jgi:hypothetical protein